MKRLLAVALLALIATPCLAAGTINLSMTQQFNSQGVPLSGCKLYFYAAGTSTPQSPYADTGLSIALPNPMTCDASGRIGQFYLADGSIKIRMTDRNGVEVLTADNLLVIGPSGGGGGGGGGVDPSTVFSTGDTKWRYGTGKIDHWVRANGRTIGDVSSGALELATSETQPLYEYLWNTDPNLAVSTGRGASATADYTAHKTIALPDARGRHIIGLDDMGSTNANKINLIYTGGTDIILGTQNGYQTFQIQTSNLPTISYTPAGSVSISLTDPGHSHGVSDSGHSHGVTDPGHTHTLSFGSGSFITATGSTVAFGSGGTMTSPTGSALSHTTGISINGATTGVSVNSASTGISGSGTLTGTAANLGGTSNTIGLIAPSILMTLYIKL